MENPKEKENLVPSWINISFLETALKTSEENLEVMSYEINSATTAGDHYSSELFRVKVQLTRDRQLDTKFLIIKTQLSTSGMGKITNEAKVFERESLVLSKIIPKIHSTIQGVSSEKIQPFAPECFYSYFGPPVAALVLEDLKDGGFKLVERTEGLDMDHCLLVLRTLAKYHAASLVGYKQDPELFKMFDKDLFEEKWRSTVLEPLFGNSIRNLVEEMKNWPEFDERFPKQLKKISEIAATYLIEFGKKRYENFNVFIHGDFWTNNMMFRYSETTGKVQEVRFLDFPSGHVGAAAIDVQHFLHTSTSMQLINEHHILLEEYHKALGDAFTLLGHKHLHPTFQQLKKQMDNIGMYAVIVSCSILPIILSDEAPDIDNIIANTRGVSYSGRYKNALKILLSIFEDKGWLNIENYCIR